MVAVKDVLEGHVLLFHANREVLDLPDGVGSEVDDGEAVIVVVPPGTLIDEGVSVAVPDGDFVLHNTLVNLLAALFPDLQQVVSFVHVANDRVLDLQHYSHVGHSRVVERSRPHLVKQA